MDKEQLKQYILDFIEKNPEIYQDAMLKLDEIFESAISEYENSESRIKEEIINDPRDIENPEQELLDRLALERDRIKAKALEQVASLQASYQS